MRNISLSIGTFNIEFTVGFDAEIEPMLGGTEVELELLNLCQRIPDADPDDVNVALDRIRTGMASILLPRGFGAYVIISNLCINYSGFRPYMFEHFARESLREAIENAA
jgi:hypothetical protein